jgi:translation elongation factor EF-1alpha
MPRNQGEVTQRKPRMLPHRSTAIVDIKLERALCLELFSDYEQFGRFMLRANSKTVAAGMITRCAACALGLRSKLVVSCVWVNCQSKHLLGI